MALDWPDVEDLKKLLDVTSQDPEEAGPWDDHLQVLIDAGISHVKQDVGGWDELVDTVTPKLHMAALRAAIVMRPNGPLAQAGGMRHQDVDADPAYQSLMMGKRRRFGTA